MSAGAWPYRTRRGQFLAVVKEGENAPFLALEPCGDRIDMLADMALCLDLKPGTSLTLANEIARFYNEHICGLAVTLVGDP